MRVVALGFGLNFSGISVKRTSVSPSAKAGIAHVGIEASRLVAAKPLLSVSRRVISPLILCLPQSAPTAHLDDNTTWPDVMGDIAFPRPVLSREDIFRPVEHSLLRLCVPKGGFDVDISHA